MKTKTPAREGKEPKFEESLERLESLVQEMESGDLPLEDILRKYEEGNRLIKLCAARLNEAEQRIETLMKEKDGSIGLAPLELEASEDEDDEAADEGDDEPKGGRGSAKKQEDLF